MEGLTVRVARRVTLLVAALMLAGVTATGVWLWQGGYRAYVVHTGSMTPTYKPGSLVIDGPAKGNYHPGEVITFRHSASTTDVVTHRITGISRDGLIHTKGDGNRTPDVWSIRPDQVRGAVVFGVPVAGYAAVYLQQPAGIASVVTITIALILLWGLFFPSVGRDVASSEDAATVPRPRRSWARDSRRPAPSSAVLLVTALLVVNVVAATTVIVHHSTAAQPAQAAAHR
jgi:signal peptidase